VPARDHAGNEQKRISTRPKRCSTCRGLCPYSPALWVYWQPSISDGEGSGSLGGCARALSESRTKNCLRRRSATRASATTAPSSRLTARPYPRRCWTASPSVMRKTTFPDHARATRVGWLALLQSCSSRPTHSNSMLGNVSPAEIEKAEEIQVGVHRSAAPHCASNEGILNAEDAVQSSQTYL
jgi:hypothetical protein